MPPSDDLAPEICEWIKPLNKLELMSDITHYNDPKNKLYDLVMLSTDKLVYVLQSLAQQEDIKFFKLN